MEENLVFIGNYANRTPLFLATSSTDYKSLILRRTRHQYFSTLRSDDNQIPNSNQNEIPHCSRPLRCCRHCRTTSRRCHRVEERLRQRTNRIQLWVSLLLCKWKWNRKLMVHSFDKQIRAKRWPSPSRSRRSQKCWCWKRIRRRPWIILFRRWWWPDLHRHICCWRERFPTLSRPYPNCIISQRITNLQIMAHYNTAFRFCK